MTGTAGLVAFPHFSSTLSTAPPRIQEFLSIVVRVVSTASLLNFTVDSTSGPPIPSP